MLIFGYRHHKNDSLYEGSRIISKKFYQSWGKRLLEEIEEINSNQNMKHPVIITFVTKL